MFDMMINNPMRSLLERINANNIPEDAKQVVKDNDGNPVLDSEGNPVTIVRKTYVFDVVQGNRGQVDINDTSMIVSIERIRAAMAGKEIMSRVVCKELARLAEREKDLQKLGFKDIVNFGSAMFGFNKTTSTQYVRIGKWFINDDYSLINAVPSTISISGMNEMLAYAQAGDAALDVGMIASWYADGVLYDGMSKAKIRAALLDWKNSKALASGEAGESSEGEAKKEGKKRGRKSKEGEASKEGEQSVNLIDRLNAMTEKEASAYAISSLNLLTQVFEKFAGDMEQEVWKGSLDMLRDIAIKMAGSEE